MKFSFLVTLCILLVSCRNPDKLKHVEPEDLNGKWCLNKWTYYHTLDFSKDGIFVDNHIDRVFVLKYGLSYDTLITWSEDSKK